MASHTITRKIKCGRQEGDWMHASDHMVRTPVKKWGLESERSGCGFTSHSSKYNLYDNGQVTSQSICFFISKIRIIIFTILHGCCED